MFFSSMLRLGQYVDQSSSRGLQKFCEDIPLAPKLWGLIRWILRQILNFHDQEFFGRPHPHLGLSVRYQGLVNL